MIEIRSKRDVKLILLIFHYFSWVFCISVCFSLLYILFSSSFDRGGFSKHSVQNSQNGGVHNGGARNGGVQTDKKSGKSSVTAQYSSEIGKYSSGTGKYSSETGKYSSGTGKYISGTEKYSSGTGKYSSGTEKYSSGSGKYSTETEKNISGREKYNSKVGL